MTSTKLAVFIQVFTCSCNWAILSGDKGQGKALIGRVPAREGGSNGLRTGLKRSRIDVRDVLHRANDSSAHSWRTMVLRTDYSIVRQNCRVRQNGRVACPH